MAKKQILAASTTSFTPSKIVLAVTAIGLIFYKRIKLVAIREMDDAKIEEAVYNKMAYYYRRDDETLSDPVLYQPQPFLSRPDIL